MEREKRFKVTLLDIFSITCLGLNWAAFAQLVDAWVAITVSSLWILTIYIALRQEKVG